MTRAARGPVLLAVGSVASGLLAYVLFALVTRGLGAAEAAPVTVLWTVWALAGAAVTFPLQHWITHSVVSGREGDVRRSAGRVATLVVAGALALGGVSWAVRGRLFRTDDVWFPVLTTLVVVGAAAVGVLRGGLAGRGRMGAVALTLVAENALRCVLVGVLLAAGVHDPVAHGLCLVAGSLVAVWPPAWRYADAGPGRARPLAFLGGAASGQLAAQVVLTGGAVLVALLGGARAEVTSVFAALAVFRAPYQVALGVLPQLTAHLSALVSAGDGGAVRVLARRLALLTAVGVPTGAALGAFAGPAVLRVVFGGSVDLGAGTAALVAAGCTLALTNVALMVGVLVHDRPAWVATAWATALLAGAVTVVALGDRGPADRAASAFVVAELAAAVALGVAAWVVLRSGRGVRA
ncbi:hypothetical protein [Nocardioides sp.]|uniref:hypothetical protein n=1 Tax=Nocardioides sp. TaxID=35761 RepID=UPI0035B2C69E